ncbi:exocyst complex component EXO70A1-like [Punica granatum]|uniref:Exocyst subunit Exo70 family protein n=2 Tax=Punica granatum TaxID=22663 RepID=A0A2I0I2U2_PUNGR|nr:exocyst complex component EXO70A1-like [Punica granatum]PKI38153.1 hypothetical protein CRG98_041406 [Punica granatum]
MEGSTESLVAARDFLSSGIEQSRALGLELDRTGQRLGEMILRLPSLESELGPIPRRMCATLSIEDRVDSGIRPANAVLQVFNAVRELEASLSLTPASDLPTYLSILRNLEQALKFLGNSCQLAIQWLQGVAEFLEENGMASERLVSNVNKSLIILQELEGTEERARRNGGVMHDAFRKMEAELERLLKENSIPFGLNSSDEDYEKTFPKPVIQHLQAIIERLSANRRLEKCVSVYVDVRSTNARECLEPLELDYLNEPFEDVQNIEAQIRKWSEDLKFAVKALFQHEYGLCNKIFEQQGTKISLRCFAEIASRSGIFTFLQFGMRVTDSKKSPNKLLNLLDIFLILDDLRVDFTRLFGGEACEKIQAMTRHLVKRVVEGSWEIFWELTYQVELQRQSPPPSDGSVPRLVSFVTEYCNRLLSDVYRPTLLQIMVIHQSWKQEKYQEGLFTNQIYNVVKEIGLNLDTWAKAYHDQSLSCLFMMNNHRHFSDLRGTKLGDMMGDSWVRAHQQFRDYYAALYVKESWEKISAPLRENSARVSFHDARKKLVSFNKALEETYKKQSDWSVTDVKLREKVRASVMEAVLPAYQDYLQIYRTMLDGYACWRDEIKYSVQELEKMIGSLFETKMRKLETGTRYHAIDDLPNVLTNNQYSLTLTAA